MGEAVVACDMPKPCKIPSLGSCQKRFAWTHKGVDLAPHPVVGFVLQAGDAEKFPQALGFESLDPFFRVNKQSPCFTAIEEEGGEKRLVELACEADGVALPDPVYICTNSYYRYFTHVQCGLTICSFYITHV